MKNVILLIIIILAGCSAKPYIVSYAEKFEGSGQNEVYVVSHGWHTGFVIPAPEIQGVIPELEQRPDGANCQAAQYVIINNFKQCADHPFSSGWSAFDSTSSSFRT